MWPYGDPVCVHGVPGVLKEHPSQTTLRGLPRKQMSTRFCASGRELQWRHLLSGRATKSPKCLTRFFASGREFQWEAAAEEDSDSSDDEIIEWKSVAPPSQVQQQQVLNPQTPAAAQMPHTPPPSERKESYKSIQNLVEHRVSAGQAPAPGTLKKLKKALNIDMG